MSSSPLFTSSMFPSSSPYLQQQHGGSSHAGARSSSPLRPPPRPSSSSPTPPGTGAPHSSSSSSSATSLLLAHLGTYANVPLSYTVHSASSFSGNYRPENILVDRPHDLASRWSGASVASMASGAGAGAGGVAGGSSNGGASAAAAGTLNAANAQRPSSSGPPQQQQQQQQQAAPYNNRPPSSSSAALPPQSIAQPPPPLPPSTASSSSTAASPRFAANTAMPPSSSGGAGAGAGLGIMASGTSTGAGRGGAGEGSSATPPRRPSPSTTATSTGSMTMMVPPSASTPAPAPAPASFPASAAEGGGSGPSTAAVLALASAAAQMDAQERLMRAAEQSSGGGGGSPPAGITAEAAGPLTAALTTMTTAGAAAPLPIPGATRAAAAAAAAGTSPRLGSGGGQAFSSSPGGTRGAAALAQMQMQTQTGPNGSPIPPGGAWPWTRLQSQAQTQPRGSASAGACAGPGTGSPLLSSSGGGGGGFAGGAAGGSSSGSGGSGSGSGSNGPTPNPNASSNSKQYILLKLDRPAIVRSIAFGKFHKPHPCNLADFKVFGAPIEVPAASNANAASGSAEAPGGGGEGRSASASAPASATAQLHAAALSASAQPPTRWVRLLRAGLRNDSVKEEFEVKCTDEEGVPFACRWIKVVPLAAHQPKYNFSVWYIGLNGVKDKSAVASITSHYSTHAESNALRLILKHLRTRGHFKAFNALLKSAHLGPLSPPSTAGADAASGALAPARRGASGDARPFEHPLLTNLFDSLVRRGAWDEAEAWLEKAAYGAGAGGVAARAEATTASGQPLFSEYLDRTLPKPRWEQIEPAAPALLSEDPAASYHYPSGDARTAHHETGWGKPRGRGGHQMCLDVDNGLVYLFGGWDGHQDLADFWCYSIKDDRWRLISSDTRMQDGPGPRSCHKMCYCPRTGFIYVLGRFVDQEKQLEAAANAAAAAAQAASGAEAVTLQQPLAGLPGSAGRGQNLIEALLSVSTGGSASSGGGLGIRPSTEATPRSHSPSSAAMAALHQNARPGGTLWDADFYRFSTRTGQWTMLSRNTAVEGGPKVIYDHQMLIDSEAQLLYVFGGRIIHAGDPNRIDLSGMYRYDVIQRSWAFLFDDSVPPPSRVPSRVGHSMLLDHKPNGQRQLWIMSGQRGDRYLTDLWRYDVATGKCSEITRDYNADGPHAGFTPRAAIDSKAREMYYFTGLVQRRNTNERVRSAFWLYSIERNAWSLIYEYGGLNSDVNKDRGSAGAPTLALTEGAATDADAMDEDTPVNSAAAFAGSGGPTGLLSSPDEPGYRSLGFDGSAMMEEDFGLFFHREKEPRPRYAAQMVFDPRESCFYLFGGNPADFSAPSARLDDFWRLRLVRPGVADVLRQTRFLVRQQRFFEMAKGIKRSGIGGLASPAALQALTYLQTEVSAVVNHTDEGESTVFRKLMSHLLSPPAADAGQDGLERGLASENASTEDLRQNRSGAPSAATSSDEMEDSDMLSISQIISQRENPTQAHFEEGRPTELYRQRTRLFNKLLNFFPADCTEPAAELSDAIGLLAARAPVHTHV